MTKDPFESACKVYKKKKLWEELCSQGTYYYMHVHSIEAWKKSTLKILFCVEVLRPSQPNGVMSSAVSLPNHTFTGQA